MKKILLIIVMFGLSGCAASWETMSDTEKQAWIFGGAIVLGAVALSMQEDNIIDNRDICFESTCEVGP